MCMWHIHLIWFLIWFDGSPQTILYNRRFQGRNHNRTSQEPNETWISWAVKSRQWSRRRFLGKCISQLEKIWQVITNHLSGDLKWLQDSKKLRQNLALLLVHNHIVLCIVTSPNGEGTQTQTKQMTNQYTAAIIEVIVSNSWHKQTFTSCHITLGMRGKEHWTGESQCYSLVLGVLQSTEGTLNSTTLIASSSLRSYVHLHRAGNCNITSIPNPVGIGWVTAVNLGSLVRCKSLVWREYVNRTTAIPLKRNESIWKYVVSSSLW
jgi:hypothetical protein